MQIDRRKFIGSAFAASFGIAVPAAHAKVDPEKVAARYKSLLGVGFKELKLAKPSFTVGEPVAFSVVLDLDNATGAKDPDGEISDGSVVRGTILSYIEDGETIENALEIGPLSFTPQTIKSAPMSTKGPVAKKPGRKMLVLLSADTFMGISFVVT